MTTTVKILEASRALRAAAEELQNEARHRHALGEISKLEVVNVRRKCVQPLLDAAAQLLDAQDALLAAGLASHVDALDAAIIEIDSAMAQSNMFDDLVTFGSHLVKAAHAILSLVNGADSTQLVYAVSELSSAITMLRPVGVIS